MSRDHYKNIPKLERLYADEDGNTERLNKTGLNQDFRGTGTLASSTLTVSGVGIKSTSFAVATPIHGGPTALNYRCYDGYVTFSGTGNGEFAYIVTI
jgi:hypothetical protein